MKKTGTNPAADAAATPPSVPAAPPSVEAPGPATPLTAREIGLSFLIALLITLVGHWMIAFGGRTMAAAPLVSNVFESGPWRTGGTFEDLNITPPRIPMTAIDGLGSMSCDEPAPYAAHHLLKAGALPWLNPYQGMGHPFAANLMSGVFYPLMWPVILLPSAGMWDAYLLLRLLLFGWFTYLYLRRVGIGRAGAAFAGLHLTFGGYALWWANLFHLSVDLCFPLLLFVIESWLITRHRGWLVGIALAMYCGFTGGNPQPLLLICVFTAVYTPIRSLVLAPSGSRVQRIRSAFLLALPVALMSGVGLMLAGFLVLPFLELFSDSFKSRTPTMGDFAPSPGNRIFFFFPALEHVYVGIDIQVKNGAGTSYPILGGGLLSTPFLLAAPGAWRRHRSLFLIFAVTFCLSMLKAWGFPPFQFFYRIPVFQNLYMAKYLVLLVFASAVLTGLGVDYAVRKATENAWNPGRILLLILVPLAVGLPLLWLNRWMQQYATSFKVLAEYAEAMPHLVRQYHLLAIVGAPVMLGALAVGRFVPPRLRVIALLIPLAAECFLNAQRDYAPRVDSYAEPPFVEFLQRKQAEKPSRLYAIGPILFPTTASAFGLEDLRHFDALVWRPYYDFIKELITGPNTGQYANFLGSNDAAVITNPLLSICNVRYIVTDTSPLSEAVTRQLFQSGMVLSQKDRAPDDPLRRGGFVQTNIDSSRVRNAVTLAAPDTWIVEIGVNSPREELRFFIGMWGGVFDPKHGDGVTFMVSAERPGTSDKKLLYSRYIDPKNNPADRKWFPARIPLGDYAGGPVRLYFHLDPGPKGDAKSDSGFLADFSLRSIDENHKLWRLVYEDEILVYENMAAMERTFLVPSLRISNSLTEMRDLLKKESIGCMAAPPVFPGEAAAAAIAQLGPWTPDSPPLRGSVAVVSDAPYRKSYLVGAEKNAVFVVSNLAYPGWVAYVNGKKQEILKPFGVLQAVIVPPGNNEVILRYEPSSVRVGSLLSLMAFMILVGICVGPAAWRRWRVSRQRTSAPPALTTAQESP